MSEFRKDMRKDIGNKKIAIVQSLVEVSGFIANLIDIIDGHSNEIDRLTAELAAKDEWTPITSVEQVEGLAAGFYELNSGKVIASKWHDGGWKCIYSDGEIYSFPSTDKGICRIATDYKLIRAFVEQDENQGEIGMANDIPRRNRIDLLLPPETAIHNAKLEVEELGAHPFLTDAVSLLSDAQNKVADFLEIEQEPAAPSIPEGAIENTLENRNRLEMGYYLIIYPDSKILASFTRHYEFVTMSNNGLLIDKAKYFYKLDENEMLAALEALAKGEQ